METRASPKGDQSTHACAACHRRKLKCDRNPQGCKSCEKSDIPCVYSGPPSKSNPATSKRQARKPRGPYQKGKTPREKELEHVVELLQQKCTDLEVKLQPSNRSSSTAASTNSEQPSYQSFSPPSTAETPHHNSLSRNLPITNTSDASKHPSPSNILELWMIYTTSVDKVTKIIHCPTFSQKILAAKDNLQGLDRSTEAIMFSVYYAAINTLDNSEVLDRFAVSKEPLLSLYQTALMNILTQATDFSFEMLQALVIHVSCLRRQSGSGASAVNIFKMAMKRARQLNLDKIPLYDFLPPFQAEYRRRAWWMICRHESAYAEELKTRKVSIMHTSDIALPFNVNDLDIYPEMTHPIIPRTGLTDVSLTLMTYQAVKLVAGLAAFVHFQNTEQQDISVIRARTQVVVENARREIEQGTLRYCDISRPFDWLILLCAKIIMTKIEILLLEPPSEADLSAYNAFHDVKVTLSLDVIDCHQLYIADERLKAWLWNIQHTHQWFATVYVLEELTRRPGAAFAARAWPLIDLIFGDLEVLNKHGMQPEDRTKLLEAHGNALRAREEFLGNKVSPTTITVPHSDEAGENQLLLSPPASCYAPDTLTRTEPWQFDQSLFDVEQAQLNIEAFFWPSISPPANN